MLTVNRHDRGIVANVQSEPFLRLLALQIGLLVGLFGILWAAVPTVQSGTTAYLRRSPHRVAVVRWSGEHSHPATRASWAGSGYTRDATGAQPSWVRSGDMAAAPEELGSDSEGSPDPLKMVSAGVWCPTIVCAFAQHTPVVCHTLLHFFALPPRAPPTLVA